MCVCLCVCVLDGEGNRVFASRALVVLVAVHLTGYNTFPTGFREPLSL